MHVNLVQGPRAPTSCRLFLGKHTLRQLDRYMSLDDFEFRHVLFSFGLACPLGLPLFFSAECSLSFPGVVGTTLLNSGDLDHLTMYLDRGLSSDESYSSESSSPLTMYPSVWSESPASSECIDTTIFCPFGVISSAKYHLKINIIYISIIINIRRKCS